MEFQQPVQQNQPLYFQEQPQAGSKKKLFLIIGGVGVLLIAILALLFSGGSSAGQTEMRQSLQAMSDAVGIMDEYEDKLQVSTTKNDIALMRIILRGNFQKLNELYGESYSSAKELNNNPKADETSKKELDAAARNNTLDSEIISVLKPKIATSEKYLKLASPTFSKPDSVSSIKKSLEDFNSIESVLNQAR